MRFFLSGTYTCVVRGDEGEMISCSCNMDVQQRMLRPELRAELQSCNVVEKENLTLKVSRIFEHIFMDTQGATVDVNQYVFS